MSDESHDDENETASELTINRRRVLQATGAGIGGASLVGFSGEVATAKTDCARGPFESTHEAGTVNVGQIRADQVRGEDPGPMGAAAPRPRNQDGGESPPPANAQRASDGTGTLRIGDEYDGVNSLETRGGVPSDSQIAVGDGRLVHALNRYVAIYDKQTGNREQFFRLERLWDPVVPEPEGGFAYGVPFVFDPRARYDRKDDRYIVCATQYQPGLTTDGELVSREDLEERSWEGDDDEESDAEASVEVVRPPRGWFLVAVSASSNPNGTWNVYRVPPVDADGVDNVGLVDYPTLGFDEDAIYLTQNFFGATTFEVTMVTLDKEAMYAGETVSAHHFDEMTDPDSDGSTFTVQPAQQPYSGGSDGTFYLVNSDFPAPFPGPTGTLTLWELTDPLDAPTLECYTLDVEPYVFPPAARQPDTDTSFIDTLGTRVMNADFDDGSVWTAHSTAVDWNGDGTPVAAIRWYEIDVASGSVRQSGTYGAPDTSYFMPTVGSDGDATAIVHNVSGPQTYPRMDVAGRTADSPLGEIEDSVVVEDGESKYVALPNEIYGNVERWGDYNGVSVDPSTGNFWTVSQYSPDIDIPESDPQRDPFFTRIAEIYFDEGAPGSDR